MSNEQAHQATASQVNPEDYGPLKGMEGPFFFRKSGVLYYDPRAGLYYDRGRDMYMDRDECPE